MTKNHKCATCPSPRVRGLNFENANFENEDVKYIEKEFNNIVMDEGYKTLFNFLKLKEFVKLITEDIN